MNIMRSKYSLLLKLAVLALVLGLVVLAVVLVTTQSKDEENVVYERSAVVTNGLECAKIGMDILKRGGSAVDAAVSSIICEGITCPQSSGLGGGFLATIYIKETGKFVSVNAREVAPKKATKDMFQNSTSASGGLSIAVPGELKGLWEIHQKYGVLNWADLFEPNIQLCRKGHEVTDYLAKAMRDRESRIFKEASLREVFINPTTNRTWERGNFIKRLKLAESLEIIAREGADSIYSKNGSLIKTLVNDIQSFNGIITEDDFLNYKVIWGDTHSLSLDKNHTLYTVPLAGSGAVLTFMLNILKQYELKDDSLSYHRLVEAFKFGYAKRTMLGDDNSDSILELVQNLTNPQYATDIKKLINDERTFNDFKYYGANVSVPDDHGTAHISILAPNGDAVSITSTINFVFGAFVRSQTTGIILNNEMDDFSIPDYDNIYDLPPSPANFIRPGKHPLSSMCPSIVLNQNGNVRMIIGGAGGSKITTSVAYVVSEHYFKGKSLQAAMEAKRLHHQLLPMTLSYEHGFDSQIIKDLNMKYGHNVSEIAPDRGFAALTGLSFVDGKVEAVYDPRRGGSYEIFPENE